MTYLHKFKCLNCRLHFIVCSWYKEIASVYCPECGKKDDNIHWIEEVDQPIFKFVPGPTPPPGFIKEREGIWDKLNMVLRFFKRR
jgi:hypothetical protein